MSETNIVRIGRFRLDDVANRLVGSGEERPVSPLASRLLILLASKRGEPVSRSALIDALWDGNQFVGDNALNRLVSETRRALGDSPQFPRIIQTVPRVGYRLVDDREIAPDAQPGLVAHDMSFRRSFGKMPPALFWLAAIIIALLGLHWLIDEAIGLVWILRHPS